MAETTYMDPSGTVITINQNLTFMSFNGVVIDESLLGAATNPDIIAVPTFTITNELPGVTPPTGIINGPYTGLRNSAIPINVTITPGTDPFPTIIWSTDGSGTFGDNSIPSTEYNAVAVGTKTLFVTISSTDAADVVMQTTITVNALAPVVNAGGTYAAEAGKPLQLNATVTPGTDPNYTLIWIQHAGDGSFNDATLEDPIWTPTVSGTVPLSLTAITDDSPDVTNGAVINIALAVPEELYDETGHVTTGAALTVWNNLGSLGGVGNLGNTQSLDSVIQDNSNELPVALTTTNAAYARAAIDQAFQIEAQTLFIVASIPARGVGDTYLINNYVTLASNRSTVVRIDNAIDTLSAYKDGDTPVVQGYDPAEVLIIIVKYDGANSFIEINGVRSALGTTAVALIYGMSLFADQAGSFNAPVGTWIGHAERYHYSMSDTDIAVKRSTLIVKWKPRDGSTIGYGPGYQGWFWGWKWGWSET